jgi:acetaldehyde dehydrogenase
MTDRVGVAVIGSGNIGADLMIKITRGSDSLEVRSQAS